MPTSATASLLDLKSLWLLQRRGWSGGDMELPSREEKGKQRNSLGKITILHCIFILKGFWELGNVKWLAVVTINIDQHVKENMVTFRSQ